MRKNILIILIFLTLPPTSLIAFEKNNERPWDLSAELSMMLTLQLDVEYFFNDSFGLKAGFGISLIGLTCFSYNMLFEYHLNLPTEHFQLDLEAGLPLAYFDFIEGRYVDWDPLIDDPFLGFLPGGGALFSYRFNEEHALGLRAAAAVMFEHQRDTGWKTPGFIPILALVYNF